MTLDPPQHEYNRVWHQEGDDVYVHLAKPLVSIDMSQCSWHRGGFCPECLRRLTRVVDEARRQLTKNVERQFKGDKVKILKCACPEGCDRHGSHEGIIRGVGWSHDLMVSTVDQFIFAVEVPDSTLEDRMVYAVGIQPVGGAKEWRPRPPQSEKDWHPKVTDEHKMVCDVFADLLEKETGQGADDWSKRKVEAVAKALEQAKRPMAAWKLRTFWEKAQERNKSQ